MVNVAVKTNIKPTERSGIKKLCTQIKFLKHQLYIKSECKISITSSQLQLLMKVTWHPRTYHPSSLSGGHDGKQTLESVECYNPSSKEWKPVTPMANPRRGLGAATLDGQIYAIGLSFWKYLNLSNLILIRTNARLIVHLD